MDEITTVQGRGITQDDIELVRRLIEADPSQNRSRISRELCLLWNWRAASGRIKDMACRTFLLKLEQRGYITLPGRRCPGRGSRKVARQCSGWAIQQIEASSEIREEAALDIDYLLQEASIVQIWYGLGQFKFECIWNAIVRGLPRAIPSIPGFGATDCQCSSHLTYFPAIPPFSLFRQRLKQNRLSQAHQVDLTIGVFVWNAWDCTKPSFVQPH